MKPNPCCEKCRYEYCLGSGYHCKNPSCECHGGKVIDATYNPHDLGTSAIKGYNSTIINTSAPEQSTDWKKEFEKTFYQDERTGQIYCQKHNTVASFNEVKTFLLSQHDQLKTRYERVIDGLQVSITGYQLMLKNAKEEYSLEMLAEIKGRGELLYTSDEEEPTWHITARALDDLLELTKKE